MISRSRVRHQAGPIKVGRQLLGKQMCGKVPIPGNNCGHVADTHVPLLANNIIWYRLKCREDYDSMRERYGQMPMKLSCVCTRCWIRAETKVEHQPLMTQSCQRAMLTAVDLHYIFLSQASVIWN